MTEAPLRKHPPVRTKWRDHRGAAICQCGSAWYASIHNVREVSEEEREQDQRRVGERD